MYVYIYIYVCVCECLHYMSLMCLFKLSLLLVVAGQGASLAPWPPGSLESCWGSHLVYIKNINGNQYNNTGRS